MTPPSPLARAQADAKRRLGSRGTGRRGSGTPTRIVQLHRHAIRVEGGPWTCAIGFDNVLGLDCEVGRKRVSYSLNRAEKAPEGSCAQSTAFRGHAVVPRRRGLLGGRVIAKSAPDMAGIHSQPLRSPRVGHLRPSCEADIWIRRTSARLASSPDVRISADQKQDGGRSAFHRCLP